MSRSKHLTQDEWRALLAAKLPPRTPEEELVLAIAATLKPETFVGMGQAFGHTAQGRMTGLRQAERVLRIVRMFGWAPPAIEASPALMTALRTAASRIEEGASNLHDDEDSFERWPAVLKSARQDHEKAVQQLEAMFDTKSV